MNTMEIVVCKTSDWSVAQWESYVEGFNEVFGAAITVDDALMKYQSTSKGYSLHALLLADAHTVVGGVSVLPCTYLGGATPFGNGIVVDVFIRPDYRNDPLALRRMYTRLKPLLVDEGLSLITAVPNATAYPYWKNIVKWKDVGDVNYWVLPVRVGNVLGKKWPVLNGLSVAYAKTICVLSRFSSLFSFQSKVYPYRIDRTDGYFLSKFKSAKYHRCVDGAYSYLYGITDEEGVKTAYLLEATRDGVRSARCLLRAVKDILNESVDIIIYVGKMGLFQTLFIRLPRRFEPKRLPLMVDCLNTEKFPGLQDIDNWDFGLINYDVR